MIQTLRQAARMEAVQTPVIPVIADLIRSTPGTISLGQGIVSYGPPREAVEALAAFGGTIEDHRYGPVEGLPDLVAAISDKLRRENGIAVGGSEQGGGQGAQGAAARARRVLVTAGGNMAFLNAVLAIADPGDEIILLAPFYFNHDMAIVMAGCRTVSVPTNAAYQPRLDALRAAITPRTRAIVTVSPNNPSGAVYSEASLRAIGELCHAHGLYHINDEAYEYFIYDGARHVSPGAMDDAAERTISLFSLSKAYGFASWRIGYMVIPAHLFGAVNKIQDTNLICPPAVSQRAALAALATGAAYCRPHVARLAEVRDLVRHELDQVSDICTAPEVSGAFYFLLRIHTRMDAFTLVERLIREHGVAAIPGTAFGLTDGCYLRISYGALDRESVAAGVSRLVGGLRALVTP
jgi:aspartate/methionine/tyrosine aminotransferase